MPLKYERPKVNAPREPTTQATIPKINLGLPGAAYQLYATPRKKGEPLKPPQNIKDVYRIVLTLSRTSPDSHNLRFGVSNAGDSHVQIAKPENERAGADPAPLEVSFNNGVRSIDIIGTANKEGRLAKLSVQTSASSFREAENIAVGAIGPFLSVLAFELDIPVRLAQLDVTQMSTEATSMTYTCPWIDMIPTYVAQNNAPYVQSLMSLYREAINSNSPNYQFLCWYKIVEGINVKRDPEKAALHAELPQKFPERLENDKVKQRPRFAEVFPIVAAIGAANENWDEIVPDEVLGWKFNRVREKKLESIRNKIAHMISEPSGDLSLSPDSRANTVEVTKWISLLRFIARVMIINERARIVPPTLAASGSVT